MQIADGTYAAKPGAASVYESDKGALVLALMVKLDDGPELKSYHTLINKDGAVNTRTVDNLKAWSGWDGADPFWFMETDLTGMPVEAVIANEPGFTDPTKIFPKVKWINPPGGGGGSEMPEAADKRAVLAKYGTKFRALAGGTAIAPARQPAVVGAPAGKKPTLVQPALPRRDDASARPPVQPPPAQRKPAQQAGSTQAAAWGRLCELGASLSQENKEEVWFTCVDATGMDQADMTPVGWEQVRLLIENHFASPGMDNDPLPI